MTKTDAILKTRNLVKHFDGVRAVDDLSISIAKGKVTSVIGPNGSGKTTLTNVLSGLASIDGGCVVLHSVALKRIRPFDMPSYGMTRTFQQVRLFEQMPVLDNVLVVLTERSVFGALFERHGALHVKQAEEALKKVGLWEKRDELAGGLSYGQRKLLEIARVLALCAGRQGDMILLDEPFAGLFPKMVKTVSNIITALRDEGRTIILIEHNMDLIRELSDHVIVMDSGRFLAEGSPEEVLERKDVIEAYLGE
ncbi:MAG: ABC transporter ATP-binding protein [Deltaproteobacteria bacterium]|nr:ABC transporter ATP-binding protein [Deltaproteobacteria bacterium]